MLVKEIMSTPVASVKSGSSVKDVANIMRERNIGSVIVVGEDGKVIGLVTEASFLNMRGHIPFTLELAPILMGARNPTSEEFKKVLEAGLKLSVDQIMTKDYSTTKEDEEVGVLISRMLESDLKHVPVVSDGKPVGMVARHDLLKALSVIG